MGINTRGVLGHAANIFDDASPTPREVAAIEIGELVSQSPVLFSEAQEYAGDNHEMKTADACDFLNRASEIGFVDVESDDPSNTLLFNGNLFKRDSVKKSKAVLTSLNDAEQTMLTEINEMLNASGCVLAATIESRLST